MKKLVLSTFMFVLLLSEAGAKVEFASHQAVYELAILESTSSSLVKSVAGRTSFMMQRHCDGWQSVENYAVSFGFEDGQSDYISHYESWESINGKAFSFSVHENSSIDGQARFNGFAHRDNGVAEAYFVNGGNGSIALPDDTIFPVTHMLKLLEKAIGGEKFLQSTLFHGGEEDDALYRVSSVIGNRKSELQPVLGQLGEDGYWPLRLAYFDPASLESSPEYEIELDMQENGVIRSYLIDYGDFSMYGTLMRIEPLEEPDC